MGLIRYPIFYKCGFFQAFWCWVCFLVFLPLPTEDVHWFEFAYCLIKIHLLKPDNL